MKVHPIIQLTLHRKKYPSHCVLLWCSSKHANIMRWGGHIRNSDKILDEQKHPKSLFLGLSHTQIGTMGNMKRMIKLFVDMHD
jgi:hypothetical protein